MFSYQKIYQNLSRSLSSRNKDILERRFGLNLPSGRKQAKRETLEVIGSDYGLTRERVRQIEEDSLKKLREKESRELNEVFQRFLAEFRSQGNLKREDILLNNLGGSKFQNHVFFLLNLGESFQRHVETEELYPFWTVDENSVKEAKKIINLFIQEFKRKKQPLNLPQYLQKRKLPRSPSTPRAVFSYLEISKNILKGPEGLYGLQEWPEINPQGVKDKIYLALKKEKKPLHFREIARLIQWLPQTVHNELIRDSRFVLVGRGVYGLKEWGYMPGVVREVIYQILKEAKKPLSKQAVVKKVLSQRLVKENTILLNLSNRDCFIKNSKGKYFIRES